MKRFIDWLHPVPTHTSEIREVSPPREVCPHKETRMWETRGEERIRRCRKCSEIV